MQTCPYERYTVTCPFYRGEYADVITCEYGDSECRIFVFGRDIKTYCQANWRKCQIARMNWAQYDDLSNLQYMKPDGMAFPDQSTDLNEKQRRFCEEYMVCQNATQAYMIAYPTTRKASTAAVCASQMFKKDKIKGYLARMECG